MATRQYFSSEKRWTADRDEAHDFGLLSGALRIARKLHVSTLEVVVSFDDSEPVAETPFEKFLRDLSHPQKRRMAGSRV
jgi:hypothetical protein